MRQADRAVAAGGGKKQRAAACAPPGDAAALPTISLSALRRHLQSVRPCPVAAPCVRDAHEAKRDEASQGHSPPLPLRSSSWARVQTWRWLAEMAGAGPAFASFHASDRAAGQAPGSVPSHSCRAGANRPACRKRPMPAREALADVEVEARAAVQTRPLAGSDGFRHRAQYATGMQGMAWSTARAPHRAARTEVRPHGCAAGEAAGGTTAPPTPSPPAWLPLCVRAVREAQQCLSREGRDIEQLGVDLADAPLPGSRQDRAWARLFDAAQDSAEGANPASAEQTLGDGPWSRLQPAGSASASASAQALP